MYRHHLECELDFSRFKTRNCFLPVAPSPVETTVVCVETVEADAPPPQGCPELLCGYTGHASSVMHFDAEWL